MNRSKPAPPQRPASIRTPGAPDLKLAVTDLEFHREGVAWLWHGGTAVAVWRGDTYGANCSCRRGGKDPCEHLRALLGWDKTFRTGAGGKGPGDAFRGSVWYRLAAALAEGEAPALGETRLVGGDAGRPVSVLGRGGAPLAV